jgi:hypothetical protein
VEEILVACFYTSKVGNWGGVNLVVFKVGEDRRIVRWGEGLIGQSNIGGASYPDYDTLELLADGTVVFDAQIKGPMDPTCCPSKKGYSIYKIQSDGAWVETRTEVYP